MSISLYSSSTASVLSSRQKAMQKLYGFDIDMKSTAFALSGGKQEDVLNRIGVELGINETPMENNLSFNRYVSSSKNADDIMFQGNDGMLYNLDFSENIVTEQSETAWIDENYKGLIMQDQKTGEYDYSDRNYDVIDFGQNSAEIINYSFTGIGDGCDKIQTDASTAFASSSTASKWGDSIQWVYQEVDLKTPSYDFISNVNRNSANYISKQESQDIYQKQGYEAYFNELIKRAASAMSYNDSSGFSISDYFAQKEAEEAEKAAAAAEAQKLEELAKLEAARQEEQEQQEAQSNIQTTA